MNHSDFTSLDPILGTDFVILLRTSAGTSGNSKALISDFLDDLVALIGTDDLAWTTVNKTGSDLADLATKSHTDLTDIGTNTHAQIDTALAAVDGTKFINFAPFPSDIEVEIRDGVMALTVPAVMNTYNLTAALASVSVPGVGSGSTEVQVRRVRAGSAVDMLTLPITISAAEYNASDGTINTANDDINTGDQIFIDVNAVTATTPPKGLSVVLTFS